MCHLPLPSIKGSERASLAALLFVLASTVSACQGRETAESKNPTSEAQELVFAMVREPDSFIPILSRTEESHYLSELVFDGLINRTVINEHGKALYTRALCKRYKEESSANRGEITIELNTGASWHNGVPFTADDVLFTWEALHGSNSPLVGWLDSLIEQIYKADDDELHVTLKVERSEEALNEIFSAFKILPRVYDATRGEEGMLPADLTVASGVVNDFNYRPIGTGPYRVANRSGNQILLERNENYFLGPPHLSRLRMQRMEAPELAIKALVGNSLDLIFDVRPRFFSELGQAAVRSLDYTPYSFYAIAYNLRRPPFSRVDFRRGVSMGTDKSSLFSTFTGLRESEAYVNRSLYPHNYEFAQRNPQAFTEVHGFSPDQARRLLNGTAAGFTLTISSELQGTNARKLAQAYAATMQELGVAVEINDLNMSSFDRVRRERSFEAIFLEFSGLNHLYDFRGLFGDDNLFGLRDANLGKLLHSYGHTLTWIELERLSRQIHNRVEELAPACFLFTPPRRAYLDAGLSNVSIHPEVGFATVERWEFR